MKLKVLKRQNEVLRKMKLKGLKWQNEILEKVKLKVLKRQNEISLATGKACKAML